MKKIAYNRKNYFNTLLDRIIAFFITYNRIIFYRPKEKRIKSIHFAIIQVKNGHILNKI